MCILSVPAVEAHARPDDGAAQARISAEVFANKALEHFYSAEFSQAAELYKRAAELQPDEPLHWDSIADSQLFELLLKAGRLDSQLYAASNEFLDVKPPSPDPARLQAMWDALARARSLCDSRTRQNTADAGAYYALAVSYAVEANYYLNLARKPMDALHSGQRARDLAARVRQLDPSNSDANLIIGAYEYAVGSVPASFRWMLYLAGYSGNRERGVQLIQDAMLHGKRTSTAALALLAVSYSREKLFAYSRQMFQYLAQFFPRNHLYELEIARTYQREGNLGAAIEVYKSISRKFETRAAGFDRVDAVRLYFQIASLLELHRRTGEAMGFYLKVLSQRPADGVLHAQSYLRLGEIYRSLQQREKAREMYENARRLPFPDIQRQAGARLRAL